MEYWIDRTRVFNPGHMPHLPLVHITQRWETLELILKEGLKPNYCTEYITNNIETKTACFPMISLSNMSIDNSLWSQKSYGTLGIVFDKSWGQENDFNPILYLDRQSNLTNEIIETFDHFGADSPDEILDIVGGMGNGHRHLLTRTIIKVFAHSKNYDGILVRNGAIYDDTYPFGLEREWRKVIKKDGVPYFLVGDNINKKQEFNDSLSNIRIDFRLDHLKAVIVESEWEKQAVEKIITEKYQLTEFPSGITIRINGTRHVPDE